MSARRRRPARLASLALLSLAAGPVLLAAGRGVSGDPAAGGSASADTMVIGVVVGVDTATVFSDGPARLVEVSSGRTVARAAAYQPWRFLVAGGGATAWGPWGELERSAERLRVTPEDGEARVFLDGRPHRGQAEIVHVPGRGLVVANRVEREAYLVSVVSSELGDQAAAAPEAARAQAVAARTYAVASRAAGRRDSLGVDLLSDPEADQSYTGLLEEREAAVRAVRETRDRILTWSGEPAFAFYHATCGGRTERPAEVWPGEGGPGVDLEGLPYLPSVVDRPEGSGEDFCAAAPHHRWRRAWSEAEVGTVLAPALVDAAGREPGALGRLAGVEVSGRSEQGRVTELTVTVEVENAGDPRLDTLSLAAPDIPGAFPSADGTPLRSNWFRVVEPGEAEALALEGRGAGHGVGMCQWGALERARQGAGWREILAVYYPGTEVRQLER